MSAMRFKVDNGWRVILKDFNISPELLLKKAQISTDLLSRKEQSVSVEEFYRLWEAMVEISGDPLLPLKIGQSISVEAFNPTLFAAFCSPNFLLCLKRLARFKLLIGPMKFIIVEDEQRVSLEIVCLQQEPAMPAPLIAMELVFLVHIARIATRERIEPLEIYSPATIAEDEYAHFFGVAPQHGTSVKMVFALSDLLLPFLTENSAMWEFFEPELQKRLGELETDTSFAGRVRVALMELLPAGQSGIDDVAQKLGVSKRTLQRNLAREETTFQKQLNHTRELLARHYLTSSDISTEEISFLIGYDDANSFSRAFHVWTGQTPGSVRQEARA